MGREAVDIAVTDELEGEEEMTKRKSRKQLKREHKELEMLLEGSDADNRENYAKLQEARIEVEKWQRSICQERTTLLERNIEVVELKAELLAANTAIEKIRDTIIELSHVGEPPQGLTRYVLSKKYPPFPDMSDDEKE